MSCTFARASRYSSGLQLLALLVGSRIVLTLRPFVGKAGMLVGLAAYGATYYSLVVLILSFFYGLWHA